MTIEIIEQLNGTRAGSIDATSGVRTIERHFYVLGTNSVQTAISSMDGHVPLFSTYSVGTMFIDNQAVNVSATYYGTKSWSKLEGETSGWEFVLKYTTDQQQEIPPDGSGSGTDVEWITTQGSVAGTSKNLYRTKANAVADDDPPKNDIGGELIDAGGQPTTVTWTNWTFTTTVKSYEFPSLAGFADLIGKRNAAPYEEAGIGEVLYLGFSWSKDSGSNPTIWTVTHNFSVDKEQYHAEQVAKTDSNGDIILKKVGQGDNATTHAAHVYWVQPFEKASFNNLPDF